LQISSQNTGEKIHHPVRLHNKPWHILLPVIHRPRISSPSSLVIVYGFAALIVIGTILLMLPLSSNTGRFTSIIDSFFTATSAVCVTGLTVVGTADHWNLFGQIIICILIQLGGFGFMTSATIFLLAFGRKIGLQERLLIQESMGLVKLGGLINIVKRMLLFTFITEIIGAAILFLQFSAEYPTGEAVWLSFFHSISAFNNAGFDLFGGFRSLTGYYDNPYLLLTISALVILGGISFMVIYDIIKSKKWHKLSLDTKLVLSATLSLLVLGFIVIFLAEAKDPDTLGFMSFPQAILNAFFQSVVARTAGFCTVNMAYVADYALFFTMILMFIGAASGSTGGGIKVNTFGSLIATMWSSLKGKEKAGAYGRQFNTLQVYRALTVIMVSLGLISIIVFILTITETFSFIQLLFETFSAFGTVGLTTGITPDLSIAGKTIIAITMFIGRLGPLTLVLSLIRRQKTTAYSYPEEHIRIG
jgi:trk system potassium uptake protein